MALLQFGDVFQNILTIFILLAIFFWVFKSMREGKSKQAITNLLEKMKAKEGK